MNGAIKPPISTRTDLKMIRATKGVHFAVVGDGAPTGTPKSSLSHFRGTPSTSLTSAYE